MKKSERELLVELTMLATAKRLGQVLSVEDRRAIREDLSRTDRPARRWWSPAQERRLERMRQLLVSGKVKSKGQAASEVVRSDPNPEVRTARWLREHFDEYEEFLRGSSPSVEQ